MQLAPLSLQDRHSCQEPCQELLGLSAVRPRQLPPSLALGSSWAESLRQRVTVGAWPWKQRVTQRSGEELPKKLSAKTRSQPSALRSLTVRRSTEEEERRH